MKTFVQLKDGVGFAYVNTAGETDGIEVQYGTGEEYINKTHSDGVWNDAPLIWYAEINYDGTIIEIKKTRFISEVGTNPILTPDIKANFKWLNGEWINPEESMVNETESNSI